MGVGSTAKGFCKKHDTILIYGRTYTTFFGIIIKFQSAEKYLKSHYKQKDINGKKCRLRVDAGSKFKRSHIHALTRTE